MSVESNNGNKKTMESSFSIKYFENSKVSTEYANIITLKEYNTQTYYGQPYYKAISKIFIDKSKSNEE
jgi:hypothetical protein